MIVLFINFLPLGQGAKRVVRRMTECHSVPSEGSTTQCDAGKSVGEGVEKTSSRSNSYFCVRHIKAGRCDRTKETKGTGITK